jgi:hypothetical protein
LRRLISISLLAIFGLVLFSPLLVDSTESDSTLPACCRKNGKHHCMGMGMDASATSSQTTPHVATLQEKCPYSPAVLSVHTSNPYTLQPAQAIYAGLMAHPAVIAQTESKLRISLIRSRQKRGPPAFASI